MIEENKEIVSQNNTEYKTGYFVNSYDYKFVTFIRVIIKVCLEANLKMKIYAKLFLKLYEFYGS